MVNYVNLPSVDLSGCTRLQSVNLKGCKSMSTASFAEGIPLEHLTLPLNFQTLILKSMQYITKENIVFESRKNLQGLWIENCAKIDAYAFFKELFALKGNLKYVRITGLNLSGNGSDLKEFYDAKLGGFTATGSTTSLNCKLVGTYQLTDYLDDELYAKYVEYFDELNILQSKWTGIEFADDEPDPANISNLDNQTGYKFDTPYKPSGHIQRILSLRHRVLSKHKDGMMYYYPLHDKNSYKYADSEDVRNCTDAVLDGTEGDIDMYEPHYWYKGVNDELGVLAGDGKPKKWSFYSTYENAPEENPDMLSIKVKDLLANPDNVSTGYVDPTKSSVGTLIVSNSYFRTVKMDIPEGYSKIRVPFDIMGSTKIGIAFISNNINIVKTYSLTEIIKVYPYVPYISGGYLILNIPETANRLYFTLAREYDYWCDYPDVVLGNSTNPVDWEPLAVEHKETLVSYARAGNVGGKIRCVDTKNNNITPVSSTLSGFKSLAAARGRMLATIDHLSDIQNMYLLKYGNRNSQEMCSYNPGNGEKTGLSLQYGIQDTKNKDALTLGQAFVEDEYGNLTQVNYLCTVGYESLLSYRNYACGFYFSEKLTTLDSYSHFAKNDRFYGVIAGFDYITKTIHGRFCSNFFSGPVGGSGESYYCDYSERPNNNSEIVGIGRSTTSVENGIFSARFTLATNIRTVLLAYEGPLTKSSTVSEFKQIQDFD